MADNSSAQTGMLQTTDGVSLNVKQDSGEPHAVDASAGTGIEFDEGNYDFLKSIPALTADKVASITNTLVPLFEAGLIELLKSSSAYRRKSAQISLSASESGGITIQGTLVYFVELYIGVDVPENDIRQDAERLLKKMAPMKSATITKCEIDCETGNVTLSFSV